MYQPFFYLVCLEILNTHHLLKRSYIYNILIVCNNILFLILTRGAFPAPSLVFFVHACVFLIWANVLENLTYRNTSFFVVCLFWAFFETLNINLWFGSNFRILFFIPLTKPCRYWLILNKIVHLQNFS